MNSPSFKKLSLVGEEAELLLWRLCVRQVQTDEGSVGFGGPVPAFPYEEFKKLL